MTVSSRAKSDCPSFFRLRCAPAGPDGTQLPSRLAPVHSGPRSILATHPPRLLAHRPARFDPGAGLHQHGPFPQKAGDNLTVRNYRRKVSPGAEENQARLARTELLHRAVAAHSSSHAAADSRRARAGHLRLSVRLMPPLPPTASLKVTAGPPAFPNRFTAPSFTRVFGCLQPLAWRLGRLAGASLPPERLRSPNGASVNVSCPCRPGAALRLAPLRPPRYRVWPLPPVPSERQTLTNP